LLVVAGVAILTIAGATSDEACGEEQHDGVDDRADNSGTKMDTNLRNQQVASEGANASYYYVPPRQKDRPPRRLSLDRYMTIPLRESCLDFHRAATGEPRLPERRL
jgi:hypothetical protein